MDEHEMQAALVSRWITGGAEIDGETCPLAAWEVSSDYSINDAFTGWGKPAVDFVLLAPSGQMAVLEIKPAVSSPRQCWSVLCQVTHRAHLLAEQFSPERLAAAHEACWSGRHGRVTPTGAVHDLSRRAREFFDDDHYVITGAPARRIVGAQSFAPRWSDIHAEFHTPTEATAAVLTRYAEAKDAREFRRYLALPPGASVGVTARVETYLFEV